MQDARVLLAGVDEALEPLEVLWGHVLHHGGGAARTPA